MNRPARRAASRAQSKGRTAGEDRRRASVRPLAGHEGTDRLILNLLDGLAANHEVTLVAMALSRGIPNACARSRIRASRCARSSLPTGEAYFTASTAR